MSQSGQMQARKQASDGSTPALKTRTDITRSPKQMYQRPIKKNLCPPKILQKIFIPKNKGKS